MKEAITRCLLNHLELQIARRRLFGLKGDSCEGLLAGVTGWRGGGVKLGLIRHALTGRRCKGVGTGRCEKR